MSNDVKALRSGVWYTVSSFLTKGIGFVTTPIFTRLMSKSDFGLMNNYTSWLSLLSFFVTLKLESTLINAIRDYKDSLDEYILSVLSLSSVSALCWMAIININSEFFVEFFGMDRVYLNVMMMYLFYSPVVSMYQTKERFLYQYKNSVFISILISVSTACLSVILVCCSENKLLGRILGSAVPTVFAGIILYIVFAKKGRRIHTYYWKYAIPICLPYIPHLLSLTVLNSLDRIMITEICGSEDTAMYSLAYSCGSIMTLLFSSINSAYAPWLAEKINDKAIKEVRSFSKTYVLGAIYPTVGIMLVTPEVLLILGGKSYMEAQYVMAPVSMGCICQFLYTMFVNVEQINKKTVGMAFASISAAIVNYVLNYVFIPKFGYIAAAYTTLIGFLWLLAFHMILVWKIGFREMYSYRFIATIVLIMCFVTVGVNFLYVHPMARYIVICVYMITVLILIYKKRNVLLKFMKNR